MTTRWHTKTPQPKRGDSIRIKGKALHCQVETFPSLLPAHRAAESIFNHSNKAIIGEWSKRPTIQARYSQIPKHRPRADRGYFIWGGEQTVSDETNEILQRLTRVETKIDLMITARDIAQEAQQSSKAAHHRIDAIEDEQKWQRRAVFGAFLSAALSFSVAALVAYMKFK